MSKYGPPLHGPRDWKVVSRDDEEQLWLDAASSRGVRDANSWIRRLLATLDAARLSHDRGADAVREAATEVLDYLHRFGPGIAAHLIDTDDNPGQRLRDALGWQPPDTARDFDFEKHWRAPYDEPPAALSVPAPTLPALDAETLERAMVKAGAYQRDPVLETWFPKTTSRFAADIAEALRDAV